MATFQNIYYKRTTATAKACYMCYRPTTTVLATINTVDFIYTCDVHLTDPGFATLVEPSQEDGHSTATAKKASDDEIRRIKEEWEERQRRKEQKATENSKNGDKDKDKDKDKDNKQLPSSSPIATPSPPAPIPVPSTTTATRMTHQRYILHRDVWAMRLTEHQKKRQTTAAKKVAPRLPITPRGVP